MKTYRCAKSMNTPVFIVPLIALVLFRKSFVVPIQRGCIIPLNRNILFRYS